MRGVAFVLAVVAALPAGARAGLHYSAEVQSELPSRWRGFLIDHRALRSLGREKLGDLPPSPLRDQYLAAARRWEQIAAQRALTADELADLGALHVRLGRPEKAVELLRPASRRFPEHFRIAANLGTAWQQAGDLEQAAIHLEDAVRLAPEAQRDAERLHLKLVRLRVKEGKAAANPNAVDAIFDTPEAAEAIRKVPAAAALAQQLALWLPADGRLLWLLGELAAAHGDVVTAAAILDGCVGEFGMGSPALRQRRLEFRAAADALAAKRDHDPNRGTLKFATERPLVRTLDEAALPPIRPGRVTPLGWSVLGATTYARGAPQFPKYLSKLDGTPVSVLGYVPPAAKEVGGGELLLLEYPVGCWFCEVPEPTGLVEVEPAAGVKLEPRGGLVQVTGILRLNRDNPERFPYRLTDARLSDPD